MNVRARRRSLLAPLGLLLFLGCQSIAGLQEREEAAGQGGQAAAGQGGTSGEGGAAGQAQAGGGQAGGGQAGGGQAGGGNAGTGGGGAAGTGGTAGTAGSTLTFAHPPKRPAGIAAPSTGSTVHKSFALKHILFGTRDAQSNELDPEAWTKYGFDFDGKCTTKQGSSDACQSVSNLILKTEDYRDGDGCRDNSFGGVLLRTLVDYQKDFEVSVNNSLEIKGTQTLLLEISDIDDGPDDPYAPATLYVAAYTPPVPLKWEDGTGERFIDIDSIDILYNGQLDKANGLLPDGTLKSGATIVPKITFPKGYISGGTWVSGTVEEKNNVLVGTPSDSYLALGSITLPTHLEALVFTLHFKEGKAFDIIDDAQYGAIISLTEMSKLTSSLIPVLSSCNSFITQVLSGTADFYYPAADLTSTFPYNDSNGLAGCDAISMGFGFIWKEMIIHKERVITSPPTSSSCNGGAGGTAGASGAGGSTSGAGGTAGTAGAGQGGVAGSGAGMAGAAGAGGAGGSGAGGAGGGAGAAGAGPGGQGGKGGA
jgi:hypothetical protein